MSEEQTNEANQTSQYLLGLAKRNAQAYISLPQSRALIVTGSAAEGVSDYYSDIDTIIYYDELPSEEALHVASIFHHSSLSVCIASSNICMSRPQN